MATEPKKTDTKTPTEPVKREKVKVYSITASPEVDTALDAIAKEACAAIPGLTMTRQQALVIALNRAAAPKPAAK